ncbi:hypothetical protein [Streptomyces sp. Ag109_O5-1]|uniref:hypothetical protein n=1 Tax=Streptomyces sp. Ag109_O5-1 TaxID=1938851 RepID=UPI001C840E1C|nr:hypothetical protein [Streptomyces sp. Ag109_O5-1]
MGAVSALEITSYVGGVLGALVTVTAFIRTVPRVLRRRVHRWDRLDQLLGDPDASPPRAGVLEQVAAIREELADVRGGQETVRALAAELVPNSGSSFRDAYDRDQHHQQQVNEAIAAKLGIELPPLPPRTVHHHDDHGGQS